MKNRAKSKGESAFDPLLIQIFPPGFSKGDRKKALIVLQAIKILSEEGIEALSFDRISELVGISKSHVVYYFPKKDALIMKCVEYIVATGQKVVVDELLNCHSGREKLAGYIVGNFRWFAEMRDFAQVLLMFYTLAPQNPLYMEYHRKMRDASLGRVEAILNDPDFHFSDGKHRKIAARAILDMVTGSITELVSSRPEPYAQIVKRRGTELAVTAVKIISCLS